MTQFRKILSWLLFPLTIWYAIVVFFRNALYDWGIKQSFQPPVPTIGIGNLSCGGTGKTPMADHLIQLLSPQYKTAYLSKGYSRASTGFQLYQEGQNPSIIGDEATMIAQKNPNIIVAVCDDRKEGIQQLMNLPTPPEIIILDDIFQHRKIQPQLNILLTPYQQPYYNDRILPFGNLRENISGRKRADIIIVTKAPETISETARHQITQRLAPHANQNVFFSTIRYHEPRNIFNGTPTPIPSKSKLLLVTGIAQPQPIQNYLSAHYDVSALHYNDHHNFTPTDIQNIRKQFLSTHSQFILTTEKDMVRFLSPDIRPLIANLPISYLPITTDILTSSPEFDQLILHHLAYPLHT